MSITGNGMASKEQIAIFLSKFMDIRTTSENLDETDAIAIAFCHHLQGNLPTTGGSKCKNWSDYIKKIRINYFEKWKIPSFKFKI